MATPYWESRAKSRQAVYDRKNAQTLWEIDKAYRSSVAQIQEDIAHIMGTYAGQHGLDPIQARTLLNQPCDIGILKRLQNRISTIQDPRLRQLALARVNAPAYKARITRLEAIKESIDASLEMVTDSETRAMTGALQEIGDEAYQRTTYDIQRNTGIGYQMTGRSDRRITQVLRNQWSGENYSERVWKNNETLSDIVFQGVQESILMGKTSKQTFAALSMNSKQGSMAAARLLRTETNYVAGQAELEAYQDAEIARYEYLAVLDMRTSQVCQDLDGKIFPVSEQKVGVNMHPMHPWCRSTTAPVISWRSKQGLMRRARDPITGESVLVPADMTYPQWKRLQEEHYGEERIEAAHKMVGNEASDKEQYARYRELLGKKHIPSSFHDFQVIKYSNPDEYGVLKAQARGMQYYSKAVEQEPEITRFVKNQANASGFDVVGLKYRVKGADSYLRKIRTEYNPDGNTYEVKDILRYTYTASKETLADKAIAAIADMDKSGYTTISVKNTWTNPLNAYKGVNTIIRAPSGQKFEMQYHTPESFALKNGELHTLYEKWRLLSHDDPERSALEETMQNLSKSLPVPTEIEKVAL